MRMEEEERWIEEERGEMALERKFPLLEILKLMCIQ